MKKIVCLLLISALATAGCGGDPEEKYQIVESSPPAGTSDAAQAAPQPDWSGLAEELKPALQEAVTAGTQPIVDRLEAAEKEEERRHEAIMASLPNPSALVVTNTPPPNVPHPASFEAMIDRNNQIEEMTAQQEESIKEVQRVLGFETLEERMSQLETDTADAYDQIRTEQSRQSKTQENLREHMFRVERRIHEEQEGQPCHETERPGLFRGSLGQYGVSQGAYLWGVPNPQTSAAIEAWSRREAHLQRHTDPSSPLTDTYRLCP